jgi:hypothetical protein
MLEIVQPSAINVTVIEQETHVLRFVTPLPAWLAGADSDCTTFQVSLQEMVL